ncbi:hypothetical protein [Candidatus Tisiphia endosymbiont of Hybos culiciformis]
MSYLRKQVSRFPPLLRMTREYGNGTKTVMSYLRKQVSKFPPLRE